MYRQRLLAYLRFIALQIIILLWLFAFRHFTYDYVLEPAPVEADEEIQLAYLGG
ncbi:unnamed protein product [marine sediment metagenome]|uniref:Uncharacterized protein n=1 Tax=marine sediment metagenome TaxID=412755 RepID=X0SU98_9ZZZZ